MLCACTLSSVIVLKLARQTHVRTDIPFTLQAYAGRGNGRRSVNSTRADKMTCVCPRSWHCNCVWRVCVCACICWSVSVVCTAPTLLFTVGDFRRIVVSWQAPSVSLFFLSKSGSSCVLTWSLSVCPSFTCSTYVHVRFDVGLPQRFNKIGNFRHEKKQ